MPPTARVLWCLAAALAAAGCSARDTSDAVKDSLRHSGVTLDGAGATFPYPLYTRWFSRFAAEGGARINYRAVGSGAGVQALLDGTVDFAATDAPLDATIRARLTRTGVRLVPLTIGGVAVTYHLPDITRQLRLDGAALADIFLGRIVQWNDPRLSSLNPDIVLPSARINVVTRADTSGTSWILTDYLSHVSTTWAARPGRSTHPEWPVGRPLRGNEGVASEVKVSAYSIGVVEVVYAMQNHLPLARVRNHAGAWASPQTGSLRAAASAMLGSMDDTVEYSGSITDPPGELSYPIASLSWLIIPTEGRDAARAAATTRFVQWALARGDDDALALGYAPLPPAMQASLRRTWGTPTP
jgi:phosphate transport system substrate-binding protein